MAFVLSICVAVFVCVVEGRTSEFMAEFVYVFVNYGCADVCVLACACVSECVMPVAFFAGCDGPQRAVSGCVCMQQQSTGLQITLCLASKIEGWHERQKHSFQHFFSTFTHPKNFQPITHQAQTIPDMNN